MRIRHKKTLIEHAADYVETGMSQLEAAVATAREKAGPMIADARDKAGPVLADVRDKAGESLSDARVKAGPILSDARDKATPLIAQGAAFAADRASTGASLAAEKAAVGRDLAVSRANELRGKPEPKGGKLKKLLLITGVVALAGLVAKKMKAKDATDGWQSSYNPAPAPVPPSDSSDTPIFDAAQAASDDEVPDDEAGATPDEAISDAVEDEHPVTTPDEPADVVELDAEAADKPTGKP